MPPALSKRIHTLTGLIEAIRTLAANHDVGDGRDVRVRDIMAMVGRRAYGPLLLLIGLFSISPATVLPGMTWATAALTLLFCVQMIVGARHPWLPRRLLDARLSRGAVRQICDSVGPWAARIDTVLKPRLIFLAEPPFVNIAGLFCAIAALATFPLGLVPMAPIVPGVAIVLVGLGLLIKDGLLLLLSGAIVTGAIVLAWTAVA
jgi:hypothetical protein